MRIRMALVLAAPLLLAQLCLAVPSAAANDALVRLPRGTAYQILEDSDPWTSVSHSRWWAR
jgi:hypothetical protein